MQLQFCLRLMMQKRGKFSFANTTRRKRKNFQIRAPSEKEIKNLEKSLVDYLVSSLSAQGPLLILRYRIKWKESDLEKYFHLTCVTTGTGIFFGFLKALHSTHQDNLAFPLFYVKPIQTANPSLCITYIRTLRIVMQKMIQL